MAELESRLVNNDRVFDAVVVGAGLGGVCMLHRLRSKGFSVRVLEAGSGIGGTWFWNRYPGARCDAPSAEYSYQFSEQLQQDWDWSEKYATQSEILRYIDHVADRFDLRPDIQLNTRVTTAAFDEATGHWSIGTDNGEGVSARYCIMATGVLSSPITPDIKGLETFTGAVHYTSRWPHGGIDFNGQRVGIIGTGSSAAQSIPHIASDAAHLYVLQRTPNYSVPAHNAPIEAITPDGVSTGGEIYNLDMIVLATGFDAITGALLNIDIRGRNGITLREKWEAGPRAYLGLAIAGFPNLFTINGPGSPSVLGNNLSAIEQHVNWITDSIEYLAERDVACMEATVEAENEWAEHVNDVASATLFNACNSWYRGANVPGKPRMFMPYIGVPPYAQKCAAVVATGYEGFVLSSSSEQHPASNPS